MGYDVVNRGRYPLPTLLPGHRSANAKRSSPGLTGCGAKNWAYPDWPIWLLCNLGLGQAT